MSRRINSRNKGAAGERELAAYLTSHGFPARRGQQYEGSSDSPDIVCKSLPKQLIECKRVEHLNLHKAVEKCESECSFSQMPVVMHRKNKTQWLATLPLDDFLDIMRILE